MSALRTPQYRTASRRVLGWCGWYTRDLVPEVAGERRDEIASDLHEHAVWADAEGIPPTRLRRDILLRAVRGIPHDLSWRSGQLRAGRGLDPVSLGTRRTGNVLTALVLTGGVMVAAAAVFLLVRVVRALWIGDVVEAPIGAVGVALAALLAVVGLLLALRQRSRWLGSAVLAPAAALVGLLAGDILYRVSATGVLLISRLTSHSGGLEPWWVLSLSIGVGAALGFIGAAVWWWPGGRRVVGRDAGGSGRMQGESA
ncbi:hypothetical protein [Plantibacter sp. ME-Dv--P-095]|uniref:hypothetical protein n=1 Tax=Plantibacter sp. ME-Dv--P-095 TaxID=3040299 RepID=UPI002550A9AE|nr:hypothetical protein [Plantibacter sp. ME-Dv--P-095]